ncbi:MAG: Calx-beta domain-containing protein, partial [Planctomycetota bacterium]
MFSRLGHNGRRVSSGWTLACAIIAVLPLLRASGTEIITTLAGGGTEAPSAADLGTKTALVSPQSVAVDSAGNTYLAQQAQVCKIDKTTGKISVVAGNGTPGAYVVDGTPAVSAVLGATLFIALDGNDNLYIADVNNSHVFEVTKGSNPTITTVAGINTVFTVAGITTTTRFPVKGFSGDGGPATQAQINVGGGFAVSSNGNIYLAADGGAPPPNSGSFTVQFDQTNTPWPYAVNRSAGSIDITVTLSAQAPGDVTVDYTTSNGNAVAGLDYTATHGTLTFHKGDTSQSFTVTVNKNSTTQQNTYLNLVLSNPVGLSSTAPSQPLTLGFPASATLTIVVNGANLFSPDNRIRKIDAATHNITTIAGTGATGEAPDVPGGVAAISAAISGMQSLAVDTQENLYVGLVHSALSSNANTSTGNNALVPYGRVRMISSNGNLLTVAGSEGSTATGDGVQATSVALSLPMAVAVGGSIDNPAAINQFLYIGDNARVRIVDLSTGIIQTKAGSGAAGYYGDGGIATLAALNLPVGIAVNGSGEVLFADINNNRVRKVAVLTGDLADADADGFPNWVEWAYGSNPADYSSTPFGGSPEPVVSKSAPKVAPRFAVGGRAVTTVAPFAPGQFTMRLNLAKQGAGKDTIIVSGWMIEPSNFVSSNMNVAATLLMDICRATVVFNVDQHGRGKGYVVQPDLDPKIPPNPAPNTKATCTIKLTTPR